MKLNEGEVAVGPGVGMGTGVGLGRTEGGYFKPFSSTYQDQMNQYTLNYNMNIYMNPFMMSYPHYELPFLHPPHPSHAPHPFLNFPMPLPPRMRPVTCIVIDE